MSLRSYLFSLIGSLIIVLTLSQLSLLYWVERNMAKEVEAKARDLSERVIDLAFNTIETSASDDDSEQVIKIIHSNENKEEDQIFKDGYQVNVPSKNTENESNTAIEKHQHMMQNKDSPMASIEIFVDTSKEDTTIDDKIEKVRENKHQIKDQLKRIVHQIHDKKIEIYTTATNHETGSNIFDEQQAIINDLSPDKNTQNLIRNIQIIIIISGIVALIFGYWLSIQFNKPLKKLSTGFEELAHGNYAYRVDPQGVKEIKTTIDHFNHVVSQLATLKEIEQQHKEISHLAELGEVSRGLAHALRNPIHTIGLSIEQLTSDTLTIAQKNKLLLTVQNKISHIDKNIKALLTLTTNGILRDEEVPVLAVIQDILLEYKSCTTQQQNFVVDVSPSLSIIGAESEIRSILHTLIINACEANKNNGDVIIKATANTDANTDSDTDSSISASQPIEITITDSGKGLDKKIIAELFKPHVSTKPEGAGMGLYIAKRIIQLHYQGDIKLYDNEYNKHNKADEYAKGCTAKATFNLSP